MVYHPVYLRTDCFRFLLWFCFTGILLLGLRPHLLYKIPLLILGLTGAGMMAGLAVYLQRQQELRCLLHRRVIEGTHILSPSGYCKVIQKPGIGVAPFTTRRTTNTLPIEAEDENKHILIVGDTGTGKSACIHHILYQVAERGTEAVMIYDPSGEFWKHHGRPDLGDIFIAPELPNCPHWDITAELPTRADIDNMAKSFIPNRIEGHGKGDFWESSSQKLLAELLSELVKRRGTVADLLVWLSSPATIEQLLPKATAETTISKDAKGQRSGVLAHMALIETALRHLPPRDGRPSFSFNHWIHSGQSCWVFLGARGIKNQDALRPLFSAWIETAARELTSRSDNAPPVWIIVDEFPSLQRQTIIPKVLSQGRKSGLKILISIQGRSQVEHCYGKESEAMLSSPKTKIFLRTTHYDSATWCAETIGRPLQEQVVHSYTHQPLGGFFRNSVTCRVDRREEFLVLPNTIQNLEDREGYLRYRKWVVPFRFEYPTLTVRNSIPSAAAAARPPVLLPAPPKKRTPS